MSITLDQQADKAFRTKPKESDSAQLSLMVRAAAVLLQRADEQLKEALGSPASRRAEVIEQMAYDIETNVLTALSLARHASDLQIELRAAPGLACDPVDSSPPLLQPGSEDYLKIDETIRRLVGAARQIENDLNAAVRSLPPTRRQLAAVDHLLTQVRSSSSQLTPA
jgi:hypothetical protein